MVGCGVTGAAFWECAGCPSVKKTAWAGVGMLLTPCTTHLPVWEAFH